MSTVNMAVNLGGIAMRNPINTASGTFGNGMQFEGFYDVGATLGAITCKGVAAEPLDGNPAPRLAELGGAAIMNSVGLQNPGVRGFVERYGTYLQGLSDRGCAVICQVAGHSLEEYEQAMDLFEELAPFAAGFEINISCPNVHGGGMSFGTDPKMAAEVVKAVRWMTDKPIIMKLSPNVTDITEIARACETEGADGISLINTLMGMRFDLRTRKPLLANVTGGLSGPAVFPVALRMVYQTAKAVNIPVIGMGGVSSAEDVLEMMMAGASAVEVGAANLVDPYASRNIVRDLPDAMKKYGIDSF